MVTLAVDELDEVYGFAIQLGRDAGDMLMSRARERWNGGDGGELEVLEKESAVDIVTKTDTGEPPRQG